MRHNIVIVTGASDPEMEAIRVLAEAAGVPVHQAMSAGRPVHPGNAYRVDAIDPPLPNDCIIWQVECDGPALASLPPGRLVVIDHHREGDPGYGRPPAEFLLASSVGQLIVHLVRLGWTPPWPRVEASGTTLVAYPDEIRYAYLDGCGWVVHLPNESYAPWAILPRNLVLVAAADHCLAHAYAGQCPGVDPDSLMHWRVANRAAFQRRSVDDILRDVEAARQRLRQAFDPAAGYADLRGQTIPELPEAAAREGLPFISTVTERDGRRKVVLQTAPPDLVQRFMAGKIISGLTDIYGDPARGFAGGYLC